MYKTCTIQIPEEERLRSCETRKQMAQFLKWLKTQASFLRSHEETTLVSVRVMKMTLLGVGEGGEQLELQHIAVAT